MIIGHELFYIGNRLQHVRLTREYPPEPEQFSLVESEFADPSARTVVRLTGGFRGEHEICLNKKLNDD